MGFLFKLNSQNGGIVIVIIVLENLKKIMSEDTMHPKGLIFCSVTKRIVLLDTNGRQNDRTFI